MTHVIEAIVPQSLETAVTEFCVVYPNDGEVLDRLFKHFERSRPMLAEIKEAVCEFYVITPGDLANYCREAEMVLYRQVFCYLAHRHTRFSLPKIGQFIRRDHTTVLHAVRKIAKLAADKPLVDDLDLLRLRISEKVLRRCANGRA